MHAAILTGEHLSSIDRLIAGAYVVLLGNEDDAWAARASGLHLRDTLGVLLPGPCFRVALLFRKPLIHETITGHLVTEPTGGLNIDGCRVPGVAAVPWGKIRAYRVFDDQSKDGPAMKEAPPANPLGRWPTNVVFVHSETCTDTVCAHGCPVPLLDAQAGPLKSGIKMVEDRSRESTVEWRFKEGSTSYADTGGASRFYHQFKGQPELLDWFRRLITPPGGECLTQGV